MRSFCIHKAGHLSGAESSDCPAFEESISMSSSPFCSRCETVPPPMTGPGTLHLRFPLAHSRAKLLQYLQKGGWDWSENGEMLSVRAPEEDLLPLVAPLMEVLSSTEQADVRAIFQPDGQQMSMQDFFEVESLHSFICRAQSGWLLDLLKDDRLTSVFQPIIACQEDNRVYAYECLMRGQDGDKLIPPKRILDVAKGAGLLFQLDRAARLSAIRQAANFALDTRIFINFTPTSIYDPINCLRSTVRAADECGLKREQIVFEVIESEQVADVGHLRNILDFYRSCGFQMALDDLGAGYSSLNLLSQLKPDFIKLDRELIRDVPHDTFKAMIARKLLEAAQELDVRTLAEGVETAEEWEWLVANGAEFVQGYYVAKPASPPLLQDKRFVPPQSTLAPAATAAVTL
jgi:EAL domain-containing protein (putative c-di-GMP-specific phosphodiesterase class I)